MKETKPTNANYCTSCNYVQVLMYATPANFSMNELCKNYSFLLHCHHDIPSVVTLLNIMVFT